MQDRVHLRETNAAGAADTSPRPASGSRRTGESAREPWLLPQWVLDIFRYTFYAFSKVIWRIRFKGIEHIPSNAQGGLIIAANHQTYIDPFWLSMPIRRRIRYLAWNEAFRWPVIGRLIEILGAWPLQIEGCDMSAVRRSLVWLREGGAVVIFPEGGRALPDGKMLRFKPGAVRIALEAGVPILPVTIRGAHRIWPRGWRFPHPGRLELTYHPLYHVAPRENEDTRACARRAIDDLNNIIGSAL
jgi:1-acyl-sn-glycerol-3-phosphate acyltransferase